MSTTLDDQLTAIETPIRTALAGVYADLAAQLSERFAYEKSVKDAPNPGVALALTRARREGHEKRAFDLAVTRSHVKELKRQLDAADAYRNELRDAGARIPAPQPQPQPVPITGGVDGQTELHPSDYSPRTYPDGTRMNPA